jgi:hypothetical protein
MPCNAPAVVDLRDRLLYDDDDASSLSAERVHFEVVELDVIEGGRGGVVGGAATSSSLDSGSLPTRGSGGPICSTAAAPLPLGTDNGVFATAPRVCSEGRKAWTPLTACGMIACILLK